MDTELLFGTAVILLAYAAAALVYRRWMRARLSRKANYGLSALWLSQLLLFALHVTVSEGRFSGMAVDALLAVADWSLYSEGLDSVPSVYASLQLALTAGVALWLGLRLFGKGRESAYWLTAGAGLTFLALDELVSIHNSALLRVYLAGGALWFLLMVRELWREQDAQARWNRTWVLGGMALAVAGGIVLDRFSGNSICAQVDLVLLPIGCGNIGIMEEMAELLGVLCALTGLTGFHAWSAGRGEFAAAASPAPDAAVHG